MSDVWLFVTLAAWAVGFAVHATNLHDAARDFWDHNRFLLGENGSVSNRLVLTKAAAFVQCLGLVIMGSGVVTSFLLLDNPDPAIWVFRLETGALLTVVSIVNRVIRRKLVYSFRVTDEGAIDEKGEIPGGKTYEIPTEQRRP